VLGNITIGSGSKVGAGSVVVKSVPENSTVVGIPGKIVRSKDSMPDLHQQGTLPDPVAQTLTGLQSRIAELEALVRDLLDREAAAPARNR
jgi:serine O-acetyltransferase